MTGEEEADAGTGFRLTDSLGPAVDFRRETEEAAEATEEEVEAEGG